MTVLEWRVPAHACLPVCCPMHPTRACLLLPACARSRCRELMEPDNLDELGLGERATDAVVNRQTIEGDKEAKGFTAGTHITRVKQGFLFWSWGCVPAPAPDPVCALTTNNRAGVALR